jgi:hypothetical protein
MATVIRQANLEADRGQLLEALNRWLTPQSYGHRFDWLYLNSPHGQARVWLSTLGANGPIIGAAAAFPRKMRIGGLPRAGCVLGDFFIAPQFRTIGPALQLQRACLDAMDLLSLQFFYDFPAATMLPIYKRLSIEPSARMVRLAKPLRADRKLREFVKQPLVVRSLSGPINRAMELRDFLRIHNSGCTIAPHTSSCGEEFTALAQAASMKYGICTERSAEHLNWRYQNHFERRYEMLTARRDTSLVAYVVFTSDEENGEIIDLFGVDEPAVLSDLVGGVAARLREKSIFTLSTQMLDRHPWVKLLKKLGFRERESCPVIHSGTSESGRNSPMNGQPWFLMQGDRES